jgi:hypothetical protein
MLPNPRLYRTCNSVRRPGLISFWPCGVLPLRASYVKRWVPLDSIVESQLRDF